jgi:SAM-dependent methyltransferase
VSDQNSNHATDEWNKEIQREKKERNYPKWPNEVMLKILFGGSNYLKAPLRPQPSWRVLDVGCGFANNLVPFADIGCECHGVDLTPEMAATVQEIMDDRGYKTKIQAGSNRALPYPDAQFDLLLSVNTLHYEGTEENFLAALREFRRVLKPGGGLYISTVGPEHEIYRRAEVLGGHRYRVRDFGFRTGEQFFFCDTERYLQHYCEQVFERVETGRVTEKLIKLPLDFLVALCC